MTRGRVGYTVTEGDWPPGGGHAREHPDAVSQKCTCETHIISNQGHPGTFNLLKRLFSSLQPRVSCLQSRRGATRPNTCFAPPAVLTTGVLLGLSAAERETWYPVIF